MSKAFDELWEIYRKEGEFISIHHWFIYNKSEVDQIAALIPFLMGPLPWVEIEPYRKEILDAVSRLDVDEWKDIQANMIEAAESFGTQQHWYVRQRKDFINGIDTIQAFGVER